MSAQIIPFPRAKREPEDVGLMQQILNNLEERKEASRRYGEITGPESLRAMELKKAGMSIIEAHATVVRERCRGD